MGDDLRSGVDIMRAEASRDRAPPADLRIMSVEPGRTSIWIKELPYSLVLLLTIIRRRLYELLETTHCRLLGDSGGGDWSHLYRYRMAERSTSSKPGSALGCDPRVPQSHRSGIDHTSEGKWRAECQDTPPRIKATRGIMATSTPTETIA